jgi:hypothetical protein
MKSARFIVAALALSLVAAACSSGYDRGSAYDDLTSDEFGFTDEQANCILDMVEDQGLEDVVVEDDIDNVDPADIEAVTDIFGECALGDLFTDELDDAIDDAVDEELNSETG